MVGSQRWQGQQGSRATRFYISSLKKATAEQWAGYIRHHWRLENQLHWQLEVVFKEDGSQVRHQQAAQNLAIWRKLALSALGREPRPMRLNRKRKKAARDERYLLQVVQQR